MDKGYHVLRFVGVVCKAIGVLCLLFAVSVMCFSLWASAEVLTVAARYGFTGVPSLICANFFIFLFAGGIPAIFFWTLASLIELLVNINHKVDLLTAHITVDKQKPRPKPVDPSEGFVQRVQRRYSDPT